MNSTAEMTPEIHSIVFPLLFRLHGQSAASSTSPAGAAAALETGRRPPRVRLEHGMRQCRKPRIKAVFNFFAQNKKRINARSKNF
ncbi:hypothetical protein ACV229_29040 [Burkholderia sp. MR1-5-21]